LRALRIGPPPLYGLVNRQPESATAHTATAYVSKPVSPLVWASRVDLLRLPHPRLPLDLARDMHRAELRPAHRAESALLKYSRGGPIVQLTRPVWIERQPNCSFQSNA